MNTVQVNRDVNFLVVGVGGQGTLLAAEIIAAVGVQFGYDVKKSEIHGMAQRGGTVSSQVRWGQRLFSPVISPGEVHYLIALERLESLRYAHWLRPEGQALVSDYRISPVSVTTGEKAYPGVAIERSAFTPAGYTSVPAMQMAGQVGQSRANNVVMLGVLSTFCQPDAEVWLQALAECVQPRYLEANRAAFLAGFAFHGSRGS